MARIAGGTINMNKDTGNRYGWIRDLPDQRDYVYSIEKPRRMPTAVDLRKGCSSVEDQGNLGSCTAQALVGALEFLEKKDGVTFEDFSRLFIYYNERVMQHTVESDSGATLRNGIKTLKKQGVCSEKIWPYKIKKFKTKPGKKSYKDALNHTISTYRRITSTNDMKGCLASGFPFVFGFSVYESFESEAVNRTGIVPMPAAGERVLGGHAVMAVGYDEGPKRFLIRNSWGSEWGMGGYFTMPYQYLANPNLAADFWTISRANM
jgi:C1A family cysteine protease